VRAIAMTCLLAACHISAVETTPVAGPRPTGVLVLPAHTPADVPEAQQSIVGADAALRERGFRVLPLAVGFDLLRQLPPDRGEPLSPAGRQWLRDHIGVDTVLVLDVAEFALEEARTLESARYDLRWRLVSLASGEAVWEYALAGSYHRPVADSFDPTVQFGQEMPPQPIGGAGPPTLRDRNALLTSLHRAAFAHLAR
jgi:hypothetical protein